MFIWKEGLEGSGAHRDRFTLLLRKKNKKTPKKPSEEFFFPTKVNNFQQADRLNAS